MIPLPSVVPWPSWPGRVLVVLAVCLVGGCSALPLGAEDPWVTVAPVGTGRPGFSALPPERTGVGFTNRLALAAALRNRNLMNGSGVAAGDYDGDGRCDLFFCSVGGTNALYRNLGDWRFEEVSARAGVAGGGWASTGAVFEDLDGDGDLDLLLSTLGAGVQCFLNTGRGGFENVTSASGLASTAGSTSLVLGDVDGDGDLDLYVVNYGAESVLRSGGRAEVRRVNGQWEFVGPQAHRLRLVDGRVEEVGEVGFLYLNDGRGHFTPVPWDTPAFLAVDGRPKPPPLDYGLGAQMRDINGDGAPDLYLCNDFQMPDRLWLNDGQGRFREADSSVIRKFPFSSMGVDFADLDRDGHLDFFVVEMAGREASRSLRQVSGMSPYPNPPGRFEIRPQVVRNALYRGNGDGTWSEIAEYAGLAATDWSWQPVFLDVDLDGYEDVLVVNGMLFDTQDRDTLARIQAMGRQAPESSRTNLLLHPPYASPNLAFQNLGAFAFHERSKEWGFDSTRISQGVALADLDNDGDSDVVVNCLNEGALLYRNDGSAARLGVRLSGLAPNTHGIGAKVVVEGGPVRQEQEIVSGGRYLSGDEAFRTFACGRATSVTVRVTWRSGRTTVVTHVPANSRLVVREASETPKMTPGLADVRIPAAPARAPWFTNATARLAHSHHEVLFDDFVRQPLLPKQLSALGPGAAWVDLDGDHADELVLGTGRGGQLGGYRFSPEGVPTPLGSDWTAPDDVAGLTGWVTAEGRPALLAATTGYEASKPDLPRLHEITADGPGRIKVRPLAEAPPLEASTGPVVAADYDGDGDLDLFVGARVLPGGYPRAGASRLLRRDPGGALRDEPTSAPLLARAGMVSAALWCDLENDGFPELVLACEWGPIRILRNTRGRFEAWDPPVNGPGNGQRRMPLSRWTGWWTAVASGDFDGDGRLDLVAANWGWNTGYRASPGHPLRLHYLPASAGGGFDLIETQFAPELGLDVPLRSLNALARAFPFLAATYPSHAQYASVGSEAILSAFPTRPDSVSAATLSTTLFLNAPAGLVAVPLPPEAQYAPAFGVAVQDVNGDGQLDVFLAQNFYPMRVEWPRTEAGRGLWLEGDGRGGFRPVPAAESGVLVLGDQRGAALGDLDRDGRADLVVCQNGAATMLWRGLRTPAAIRVELEGTSANPAGYGVTLRARAGGVMGPMQELHAGSGYWSKEGGVFLIPASPRPEEFLLRWPGGLEQRVAVPRAGMGVRVPRGGSPRVEGE